MRILLLLLSIVIGLACHAHAGKEVVLVGGPCDGCEAVFEDRPKKLKARARIAPKDEPGEPMVIEGTVMDADGKPVKGVIVYAYQTDATGRYRQPDDPKTAAERHGRLRAFVRTGKDGGYRFDTIRPGSYPDSNNPQHVHMHVVEPRCHYTIEDLHFTDDPLLTDAVRERMSGKGGSGIATPTRKDGTWWVRRDITLGLGVEDHARCGARSRAR